MQGKYRDSVTELSQSCHNLTTMKVINGVKFNLVLTGHAIALWLPIKHNLARYKIHKYSSHLNQLLIQ